MNRRIASARILIAILFINVAFTAVAAPGVSITPNDVDAGIIVVPGGSAPTPAITIANTSDTELPLDFVGTYPDGTKFTVYGCFHTPVVNPQKNTLSPGDSCTQTFRVSEDHFIPRGQLGPGAGLLSFNFTGTPTPVTVHWNAIAQPLQADDVSPIEFPTLAVGAAPVFVSRAITNRSPYALDVYTDIWDGPAPICVTWLVCTPPPHGVSIAHNDCATLAPFGTCTITLSFAPQAARKFAGSVTATVRTAATPGVTISFAGQGLPKQTVPGTVLAVEYYNASRDHYFLTTSVDEMRLLAAGVFPGWQQTGLGFYVFPGTPAPPSGATSVCRYYGRPEAGLDSHFYSPDPDECTAVASRWPDAWMIESTAYFYVYLPDRTTGICPAGTTEVFRIFNNRSDVNHRYTTDRFELLRTNGVMEGYGPPSRNYRPDMCVP